MASDSVRTFGRRCIMIPSLYNRSGSSTAPSTTDAQESEVVQAAHRVARDSGIEPAVVFPPDDGHVCDHCRKELDPLDVALGAFGSRHGDTSRSDRRRQACVASTARAMLPASNRSALSPVAACSIEGFRRRYFRERYEAAARYSGGRSSSLMCRTSSDL